MIIIIIIIIKQYLQYLYKIRFSQTFTNLGFQGRALGDLIAGTH